MTGPEFASVDATPSGPLSRPAAEALASTFRAISDPTRLQVLSMLLGSATGEATVGELATSLGLRQPTITHHLRILLEDGILTREQRGRHVWMSIARERKQEIVDLLR
ncbi:MULTISPECIES: ArsR/SmtB family transcription factor [Pseudoclavibacter]|uniref:ArsR family transcriptional regulator n=1 Tax=Pseudoclavibacter helvolus TaxID=255205 RepID=A0A7W4URZ9_9MICO|nr:MULTISPECIES: metalloregulator ArsR/SmtB family transcription factor [Pseudoclavibacter]MBB2959589.1 ArsR family transcriptional regulator [Pseudoclavibacter helvolus]